MDNLLISLISGFGGAIIGSIITYLFANKLYNKQKKHEEKKEIYNKLITYLTETEEYIEKEMEILKETPLGKLLLETLDPFKKSMDYNMKRKFEMSYIENKRKLFEEKDKILMDNKIIEYYKVLIELQEKILEIHHKQIKKEKITFIEIETLKDILISKKIEILSLIKKELH